MASLRDEEEREDQTMAAVVDEAVEREADLGRWEGVSRRGLKESRSALWNILGRNRVEYVESA